MQSWAKFDIIILGNAGLPRTSQQGDERMKLRRRLAALLGVCLSLSMLTACGAQPQQTQQDPDAIRIAVSMSSRDQFLTKVENAAVGRANEMGVSCDVWDATNDYAVQLQHVKNAVAQGYDALILNEINPGMTKTLLRQAGNLPVVFLNRQPDFTAMTAGKQVYVGSDDEEPGRYQAEWINDYAAKHGLSTVRMVYLTGTDGQVSTTARRMTLFENLDVNISLIYDSTAMYDRAKAMAQVQRILQNGEEFDVLVAQNDEMALGAIQAMLLTGENQVVCPVIGVDGTRAACQAILDGQLAFTVYQPADAQGQAAVDAALALLRGEPLDAIPNAALSEDGLSLTLPYAPVDAENAAEFIEK